jgi:hypothetical protein
MPFEILERIITFAIPRHISVTSDYKTKRIRHHSEYDWSEAIMTDLLSVWKFMRDFHKPPKQQKAYYFKYEWVPVWPLRLLHISRRIRQVAGKIICERVRFRVWDSGGKGREARELWDEFRAKFGEVVETSEAEPESSEDDPSKDYSDESDGESDGSDGERDESCEQTDDEEATSSSGLEGWMRDVWSLYYNITRA